MGSIRNGTGSYQPSQSAPSEEQRSRSSAPSSPTSNAPGTGYGQTDSWGANSHSAYARAYTQLHPGQGEPWSGSGNMPPDVSAFVDHYTGTNAPSTSSSSSSNSTSTSSNSTSSSSNSTSSSSGSLSTSSDFQQGVQLDYASGDTIAAYEQRTGTKPASVGNFIGMSNGSVDMTDAEKSINDAAQNGVGTVQLSIRSGEAGALSSQETQQLQQLASDAKAKGITLQVRFGYEMNNQGVSGFSSPQQFQTQWAQAAAAVHAGGGQMVWAVQNANPSTLAQWVPNDPSTVDAVGVDIYHFGSGAIDPNEIKAGLENVANLPGLQGKPLTIPETGVALDGTGDDASKAAQWLSMLNDPSLKAALPNYQGYDYFDYNKSSVGDIDSQLSENSAYIAALKQYSA